MKNNISSRMIVLLAVVAMLLSLPVFAATPREMRENGEVSDGSVIYGDKRDGIVSDVSSDMSDLGNEVSEFVETVLPGDDGTSEIRTTEKETTRVTANETTRANENNNMEDANRKDARWGIIIAVIVVIAVVAVIFFLMRRR